ncbi:MAG: hypothetical protein IT416_01585 [Candidatus Pacebacteria bacterium]|nr:hypothetical protein [Candidatus Paceibacterota bacterium]
MTKEKKLLHVVCDYKAGGMEFGEINTQIFAGLYQPAEVLVHTTEVPPLDTAALGFVTAQYALAPFIGKRVVYGNAAPRRDKDEQARKDNFGQGIKYARLKNGTEVVNVYSEYAFGFMKEQIVEFRDIECPAAGSQFRSRDFFPERVAKIMNGDLSVLTTKLNIDDIPDIEPNRVAWTDGFGNIKTTTRASYLKKLGLKPGEKVQVILNDVSMVGVVAIGGFAVERGVLAINLGSSGYDDPFVELFLRVHHMSEQTAAVRFGFPAGGTEFTIKPL